MPHIVSADLRKHESCCAAPLHDNSRTDRTPRYTTADRAPAALPERVRPPSSAMSSGTAVSRVSVAVPVRNEERTLAALLDALLQQTRPPDEIVVADAGSVDGSVGVARGYETRGVRVLEI